VRFHALPALVTVILLLAGAACHAKAGDDCDATPASCLDKASHLVCVNKKYVLETCRGPQACNDDGKAVVCDDTKADVGDGCGHDGARACSSDGKRELRCKDSAFAIEWSCRGGCTLDASGNPKCTPTGEVGDACRADSIVCDGAQGTELSCENGKLEPRRTCHGALGCQTASGGGVRCDRTVAVEDEKCTEEGTAACDASRKNVLVCSGGRYKTQLQCLGALGCELPGNYSVRCDKSVVTPAESCTEEGAVTCTTEGKQTRCTGGKWVTDKKWKPAKGEACSNRYRVSYETAKFEAR